MSETIETSCKCGAKIRYTGSGVYCRYRQEQFDDTHASCRGQQVPKCEICGRDRNTHEHVGYEVDAWRAKVMKEAGINTRPGAW